MVGCGGDRNGWDIGNGGKVRWMEWVGWCGGRDGREIEFRYSGGNFNSLEMSPSSWLFFLINRLSADL